MATRLKIHRPVWCWLGWGVEGGRRKSKSRPLRLRSGQALAQRTRKDGAPAWISDGAWENPTRTWFWNPTLRASEQVSRCAQQHCEDAAFSRARAPAPHLSRGSLTSKRTTLGWGIRHPAAIWDGRKSQSKAADRSVRSTRVRRRGLASRRSLLDLLRGRARKV